MQIIQKITPLFFLLICAGHTSLSLSEPSPFDVIKNHIQQNNLSELKKILKDPNIQNQSKHSPLYLAVLYNHKGIVVYLVKERKANINIQTNFGKTPLHQAILSKRINLIQWLLNNGADPTITDNKKQNALHYLVQQKENPDFIVTLRQFVKHKQYKKLSRSKDVLLNTPLYLAAYSGNSTMLSVLMQNGSSIKETNFYKQTPLHQVVLGAIQSQSDMAKKRPDLFQNVNTLSAYQQSMKTLLKQKPKNINAQDQTGKSILHYSAENGLLAITQDILEINPLIDLQTTEGWSALHLAAANRHESIVQLLIDKKANVNLEDKEGTTPLYFAVGSGSKKIVSLLLKSKANVFFTDKKTGKPLFSKAISEKLKGLLDQFNNTSKK